jgi:hypothetical protein
VRILAALALVAAGCTLLVERELSRCDENKFLEGSPDGGGFYFHQGVTQVAWHGPGFAPLNAEVSNYGTGFGFLVDGGLRLVGGFTDGVFVRDESSAAPNIAYIPPAHYGPGGFGCLEGLAATYDPLRDRTSWQLNSSGCANGFVFDAGVTQGTPASQGPALGWAHAPDGGGIIAALYGNRAEICDEVFPLSCLPPKGVFLAPGGQRSVDGLIASDGGVVWVVTVAPPTGDGETRVYSQDFKGAGLIVPWAGSVTVMDSDVALVARINQGQIQAQLFDATGAKRGPTSTIDLNDSGARGLLIARFGGAGATARAAWIDGDGRARAGVLDLSSPGQLTLRSQQTVCQSAGASFAGPIAPTTVVVQKGDGLYLRPVQ